MFTSVLVPLDRSRRAEEALRPAASLAARLDIPIDLVTVTSRMDDAAEDARYLNELAARLEVPVGSVDALPGHRAAPSILEVLEQRPQCAPCMTSHGRSGLGQLVLGSVSEEVVRESRRPLILVGPEAGHDIVGDRLVVTLDGSDHAEAILPQAARWAEALGTTVWLVQALEELQSGVDGDLLESGYLHRVASRLREQGTDAEWEVLHGHNPGAALTDFVSGADTALIAMTTHGRSGLSRLALGSVVSHVVRTSPVPVLTLSPAP